MPYHESFEYSYLVTSLKQLCHRARNLLNYWLKMLATPMAINKDSWTANIHSVGTVLNKLLLGVSSQASFCLVRPLLIQLHRQKTFKCILSLNYIKTKIKTTQPVKSMILFVAYGDEIPNMSFLWLMAMKYRIDQNNS